MWENSWSPNFFGLTQISRLEAQLKNITNEIKQNESRIKEINDALEKDMFKDLRKIILEYSSKDMGENNKTLLKRKKEIENQLVVTECRALNIF